MTRPAKLLGVTVEEEQKRNLQRYAAHLGTTPSELVREHTQGLFLAAETWCRVHDAKTGDKE